MIGTSMWQKFRNHDVILFLYATGRHSCLCRTHQHSKFSLAESHLQPTAYRWPMIQGKSDVCIKVIMDKIMKYAWKYSSKYESENTKFCWKYRLKLYYFWSPCSKKWQPKSPKTIPQKYLALQFSHLQLVNPFVKKQCVNSSKGSLKGKKEKANSYMLSLF